MELIFRLKQIKALRLRGIPGAEAWDFLCREVHRQPTCLELHIGRIQVATAIGSEAVYAALVDLMTVLKDKGGALRRRLFNRVRDRLDDAHAHYLYRYLNEEIALNQLPFTPKAVLQQGVVGPAEVTTQDPSFVLHLARESLGLGQLDQARELLENLLREHPENREARKSLLEIYRATRDTRRFQEMQRYLLVAGCRDRNWLASESTFGAKVS